jgi:serine/threonine-protein kinase
MSNERELTRAARVHQIVSDALTLDPAERLAFLEHATAGDSELKEMVQRHLAGAPSVAFLDSPAIDFAAPLLAARASHAPRGEPAEGALVGPYRLVRELGRGGMGAVWLAERADGQYEQRVALKLIKSGLDSLEIHHRFLAERQILARLSHPNVARLFDGGVTPGGQPYLVMEYVDGTAITAHCEANRLEIESRLRLFERICDAVRYAHASLVVHRDLKPSNIMVTADGTVKLLDFGIAKLLDQEAADPSAPTTAGHWAMTPEYAAPEQVRGESVTTATDIYALGAVLYELLTGRRAQRLERRTADELVRVICESTPEPPSVAAAPHGLRRRLAGDLDTIILKAMQKDPARRYATVDALLDDIQRHRAGLPVRARPDTVAYRVGKFVRRNRLAVGSALGLMLTLLAGLAGTTWQARVAAREAMKAGAVRDFVVGLFRKADPQEARGRDLTVRELLQRGTVGLDTALVSQPAMRSELLHVLGQIHAELGLFDRADTLLGRALTLSRSLYGPESPEVAAQLVTLGHSQREAGDWARAESTLATALELRRRQFGPDDSLVSSTTFELAAALTLQGEFARAESLQRAALASDLKRYGGDHLQIASDLEHLGVLLTRAGKPIEGDSVLRRAVAIQERLLGPDHPETVNGLGSWLGALLAAGKLAEAETVAQRALSATRRIYQPPHYRVAYALHSLGLVNLTMRRGGVAEPFLSEALEMSRATLGAENPATIAMAADLASARHQAGHLPEAEAAMREAMVLWQETLGERHLWTLTARNNLAAILQDLGKAEEAERIHREVLAIRRAELGDSHPDVGQTLSNFGALLHGRGRLAEAETMLREALAIYRAALPAGHPRSLNVQANLGTVLVDLGRSREALPLLQEALEQHRASSGPTSHRTVQAQTGLGVCLAAMGQPAAAESLLVSGYRALENVAGFDATRQRRATLRRLVAFYQSRGQHAMAERYRRALAESS